MYVDSGSNRKEPGAKNIIFLQNEKKNIGSEWNGFWCVVLNLKFMFLKHTIARKKDKKKGKEIKKNIFHMFLNIYIYK